MIYDINHGQTENFYTYYELKDAKKVSSVNVGRIKAEKGEYFTKGNILGLSSKFLAKLSAGEPKITVNFSDKTTEMVQAFIATKVITTAEEFQNINNDLQGYYVLGNDIDLSSIANFEPLGYYFTETSIENSYFHGVLEGNGHTVKNAKVYYSKSNDSNMDVYGGMPGFSHPAHQAGDNIGLFQIIGSSGVVRNTRFSNIDVRGRTIVGVIAGNNAGSIENCIVDADCVAHMDTHFYDNDCNVGAVAGIVAGSGSVSNTITLTSHVELTGIYTDYDSKYKGLIGNGWDHSNTQNNTDVTWKFAGVDRDKMDYSGDEPTAAGTKEQDSNGSASCGIYAFAGKTWGSITNSYSVEFNITPQDGKERAVNFSQTHLAELKPTSGDSDLGTIENSSMITMEQLKTASTFVGYDNTIWDIADGSSPSLIKDSFVKSYEYPKK